MPFQMTPFYANLALHIFMNVKLTVILCNETPAAVVYGVVLTVCIIVYISAKLPSVNKDWSIMLINI